MEAKTMTLVEKLEGMLARSAAANQALALEHMSLGELLYHALAASGDDRGLVLDGAMQGA